MAYSISDIALNSTGKCFFVDSAKAEPMKNKVYEYYILDLGGDGEMTATSARDGIILAKTSEEAKLRVAGFAGGTYGVDITILVREFKGE